MPLSSRYAAEPEGKRVVYLVKRDGGAMRKKFANRGKCDGYLGRPHDDMVSYRCYLDRDGILTLLKRGVFAPKADVENPKRGDAVR